MKQLLSLITLFSLQFSYALNPFLAQKNYSEIKQVKSEVSLNTHFETKHSLLVEGNEKCPKFKKMKKTGLILLCVGAPLAGVGIGMIAAGTALAINSGDFNYIPLMAFGYVSTIAGLGMTGAGVPLYIIGNVKSKKYCGGTSFQINQSRNGLGLAYNF